MTTSNTLVRSGTNRREAACHRCGWTQPLAKVSRSEQLRLGADQRFRWLCDDCLTELTGAHELVTTAAASYEPEHAARHRSVA